GRRHRVVPFALVGAAVGEFQQVAEASLLVLVKGLGDGSVLGFGSRAEDTPAGFFGSSRICEFPAPAI
ncbi:MAG: hypothetical protein PVG24_06625, partial [Gammaproteobacteria bacterium]